MRKGRAFLCAVLMALFGLAGSASAAVSQVGSCQIRANTSCPGANLSGADLSGANLSYANLAGANLTGANLRGANLNGANFHGAVLNHATLDYVISSHVNLSSVHLQNASVKHARIVHSNFNGSQLNSSNFYFSELNWATARGTNFALASLDVTTALYMDARGASFYGARLTNANLSHGWFEGTQFNNANFHATKLDGAHAGGTVFYPSNFADDRVAVEGVFERVSAHLDAYGSWGHCGNPTSTNNVTSDTPQGYCFGTAQPGGSNGFTGSTPRGISWHWRDEGGAKHLEVIGTNGVVLNGTISSNWHAYVITRVTGLLTGLTGDAGTGLPGGPLSVDYRRVNYSDPGLKVGYIMFIGGWLPRVN